MYWEENLKIIISNHSFWCASVANRGSLVEIMVGILTTSNRTKIPMTRPNQPDMPPKRIRKVQCYIYRTQIRPRGHDIAVYGDS